MSSSFRILAVLLVATQFAASQTSPSGERYNIFNQHTYLITPTYVGWQPASTYARSLGGYLVTINDVFEQAYLTAQYGVVPFAYPCWIGLNDAASEGTFVWDSGEPVSFTNFCAGEPNNYLGNEDHVEMFSVHTGYAPCWNDDSSPYSGAGIPATRGIVELAHGVRVNFDGVSTACASSPFPIPLGSLLDPDDVSWNDMGASLGRLPLVTDIPEQGMPVTGSKYFRFIGTGAVTMPVGGPCPRPLNPVINEVRIAIPAGTEGVSLAYDFITLEDTAPFNDGMDISVIDSQGNLISHLVYADAFSSSYANPSTGAFCSATGGSHLLPFGPKPASKALPFLPHPAYVSIACWNGTDDALPSAVHIDAIQFWGTGQFQLAITAPFGPGSLRLANTQGGAGTPYWTAITIGQGVYPNGWLFGLDIPLNELISQVNSGAPFSGTLDLSGASTFTIPAGVPAGLPIFAVSLRLGAEVTASAPKFFMTQ